MYYDLVALPFAVMVAFALEGLGTGTGPLMPLGNVGE